MCTDNPILLTRTLNSSTIMCVQRKAEKKIVDESDIIQANKLAFNDDIGIVTNHVTTMIEVQSGFNPGSKEYETLGYRIMCGQLYQQNTIDRAKGIIAKPMPEYWYSYRANMPSEDDTVEDLQRKQFNISILAEKKPYFMIYVYPSLKSDFRKFIKSVNLEVISEYCDTHGFKCIEDIYSHEDKDDRMQSMIDYYEKLMPVGRNACVINRISWIFENAFSSFRSSGLQDVWFDYGMLKCNVPYSQKSYNDIASLYSVYRKKMVMIAQKVNTDKTDRYYSLMERKKLELGFIRECSVICTNENELCDIVVDMCYDHENSKQFAWDLCGDTILRNLLAVNNSAINYPQCVEDGGEFVYCGKQFIMAKTIIEEDQDDYTK